MKQIVLDLDLTIADLPIYYCILEALAKVLKMETYEDFDTITSFQIFDLFPEIFRPYIFVFFNQLVKWKKEEKIKVMIYTNNSSSKKSIQILIDYINNKIGYPLIDELLAGFRHWKTKKKIEKCRTSIIKSIKELIKCKKVAPRDKICFIDDAYHEQMAKSYYIQIHAYENLMKYDTIVSRMFKSNIHIKDKEEFKESLKSEMKTYKLGKCSLYELDCRIKDHYFIYKQLIKHVKEFIKAPKIVHVTI